jgi:hypothetical protein
MPENSPKLSIKRQQRKRNMAVCVEEWNGMDGWMMVEKKKKPFEPSPREQKERKA